MRSLLWTRSRANKAGQRNEPNYDLLDHQNGHHRRGEHPIEDGAAERALTPERILNERAELCRHMAERAAAAGEAAMTTQSKRARYAMVRRFGYGVPSLERALASANNHVALFTHARRR
jgi:hypothetical protein